MQLEQRGPQGLGDPGTAKNQMLKYVDSTRYRVTLLIHLGLLKFGQLSTNFVGLPVFWPRK